MKQMRQIILIGLALLLTLNLAAALGIQPAKTLMESSTAVYSGQFMVINSEQRQFAMKVYIEGSYEPYINLKTTQLRFESSDDSLPVFFDFTMPDKVPPGQTMTYLVVEEDQNEFAEGISSKIIIKHKLVIQGPYPEKYVLPKVNFQEGTSAYRFISEVQNLGQKDIDEVKTTFYLNDKQQQPQVLETSSTPLKTKEDKVLVAEMKKEYLDLGAFEVRAVTTYDDQKVELVSEFTIGKPEVEVTYFTPYFAAGQIDPYSLDLLNKWNKKVKNVFVDVDVKKNNLSIDQFRTKSVDIAGLETERLQDYFDARNKKEGVYSFDMAVNFWNNYRMEKKTFQSELLPQDKFDKMPLAGQASSSNVGQSSIGIGIWIAAAFIFLIFCGGYVFYRYTRRQEYE